LTIYFTEAAAVLDSVRPVWLQPQLCMVSCGHESRLQYTRPVAPGSSSARQDEFSEMRCQLSFIDS